MAAADMSCRCRTRRAQGVQHAAAGNDRRIDALQALECGRPAGDRSRTAAAFLISLQSSGAMVTRRPSVRSEEHTSELQSLMRISLDVFCFNAHNEKTTHNVHRDKH